MVNWRDARDALDILAEAAGQSNQLVADGERIVEEWRDAGSEPQGWDGVCSAVDLLIRHVEELLEGLGVELPEIWREVRLLFRPVCTWVAGAVTDVRTITESNK